ncbi:hypothetical protein SDC9_30438 [bioreactor metagenome]|uniref:Uncharacterized protein n=1 Tax=bioreactor metagenome TaxID=1076179 RepID=A0A644V0P5_9ZZZZ
MRRRHRAGDHRFVGMVAEGHDVFRLVVLPLEEGLAGAVDVEGRIIRLGDQFLDVVTLILDRVFDVIRSLLAFLALGHVGDQRLLVGRHRDPAHDDVADIPGLGVEHVEGEPLVLHAEVEHLRIVDVDHALVEVGGREPVRRLQPQAVGQEREVVLVTGAQDDRVDMLRRAILEIGSLALDAHEALLLFPVLGPFEAHRRAAIAGGDAFRAVFPALRADVLGRIGGADDQHVLALELARVAEVMGMHDAAVELVEARIFRHVRRGEMPRGDDHMVEALLVDMVALHVVHGDGEIPGLLVELDPAHDRVEADPAAHAGLVHPPLDVVDHDGARRVGGDLLAEMLLEGIVGEFEPLLRTIGPEVAIHRAVDRLAILVGAGAPAVVPQPPPGLLLLEADDLGDLGPLLRGGLEGPELGKAGGSGADDGNAFGHVSLPVRSGMDQISKLVPSAWTNEADQNLLGQQIFLTGILLHRIFRHSSLPKKGYRSNYEQPDTRAAPSGNWFPAPTRGEDPRAGADRFSHAALGPRGILGPAGT